MNLPGLALGMLGLLRLAALADAELENLYVFTDEKAVLLLPRHDAEVAGHIATLTRGGWGPTRTEIVRIEHGAVSIAPLAEGIHIVRLGEPVNTEFRFLAMEPPPPLPEISLWPLYPRHHTRAFTSLLETRGHGDTLHPNALGHLHIARAVYDRITGETSHSPLVFPRLFPGLAAPRRRRTTNPPHLVPGRAWMESAGIRHSPPWETSSRLAGPFDTDPVGRRDILTT